MPRAPVLATMVIFLVGMQARGVFAHPSDEHADDDGQARPARPPWSAHGGVHVSGGSFGPALGATLLGGYEWLRLGGLVETGGIPDVEPTFDTLALLAGVSPKLGLFRLDALLSAGRHSYENLSNGYDLNGASGPSGDSAFIGARLGTHLELFDGPLLEPGLWLVYENDLESAEVPVVVGEGPGGEPEYDDVPASLGRHSFGVMLGVGIGFDFGP